MDAITYHVNYYNTTIVNIVILGNDLALLIAYIIVFVAMSKCKLFL